MTPHFWRIKAAQTRKAAPIQIPIRICNCFIIIPYSEFFTTTHTGRHFFQRPRTNLTSEQSAKLFYFLPLPLYVFIFLSLISIRKCQFPLQNSILQHITTTHNGLMSTHNEHSHTSDFFFSPAIFLHTLHSSTITMFSSRCRLQSCRNHQSASRDNKYGLDSRSHEQVGLSSQLWAIYFYAYFNLTSIHMKH